MMRDNMSKIKLYEQDMDCCGCSACQCICPRHAISMVENKEGFLYPLIDESLCVECKMCQRVCPVFNFENDNIRFKNNGNLQIGILSLSDTENFGAKIVTFALKHKIEQLIPNSQVNVIQFLADTSQDDFITYTIKRIKEQGIVKPAIHFVLGNLNHRKHVEDYKIRSSKFSLFDEKYLPVALKTKKISEFRNYVNQLDVIVVGSDIVFRPEFAQLYPMIYFLDCINSSKVKKISYAASIGTNSQAVLKPLESIYRNGMKNFDYISTREKESQKFLQSLTDKPVSLCCDPVLLCDVNDFQFENDFERPKRKYIFMYILDRNKRSIKYAKKLAKEKDLDIYYFAEEDLDGNGIYNVLTDGPAEFIERIKNAEYVITNSFHCIVFSIMFKKPFVAFMRTRQSLKITNILEMFGLESRAVTENKKFDIDENIDWESVHSKWLKLQSFSIQYLGKISGG